MSERNEALLRLLLETPSIEVDLRTRQGDTALCMALLGAEPSFEAGAKRLLARGAAPNPRYPGDEADTLLHRLAREGREDAALFLLEPCDDQGTLYPVPSLVFAWIVLEDNVAWSTFGGHSELVASGHRTLRIRSIQCASYY